MENKKKWEVAGYLSRSRTGANAVVAIGQGDGTKIYYVADINEALDVLTGRQAFTRLLKRRAGE